jgi:hypothetical protein
MSYVNPLCAHVSTRKHATGLFSAAVTLDHGLPNQSRVFHRFGYLSEPEARRGGNAVACALGRSVIAAGLALAMVTAGAPESRADSFAARFAPVAGAAVPLPAGLALARAVPLPPAPVAPLARIMTAGAVWQCGGPESCAALLRALRCVPLARDGRDVAADCDAAGYRRALARHSA